MREPSRKEKGSRNHDKARTRVARIADRRRDFLHKLQRREVGESPSTQSGEAN